jgi:D-tyrosyl-tRNA(Tyr) deacylase
MRVLVQRVSRARVESEGRETGRIGAGLALLVGVAKGDGDADADWAARKVLNLRIFDDENGVMNRSALDVGAGLLAVSQFTLCAETAKGNRPSYINAAGPAEAEGLFGRFVERLKESGLRVGTGVFRTEMDVELVNHGPVTIWLDSRA